MICACTAARLNSFARIKDGDAKMFHGYLNSVCILPDFWRCVSGSIFFCFSPYFWVHFCFSPPVCTSGYCYNGGSCSFLQTRQRCTCPVGWTGNRCQAAGGLFFVVLVPGVRPFHFHTRFLLLHEAEHQWSVRKARKNVSVLLLSAPALATSDLIILFSTCLCPKDCLLHIFCRPFLSKDVPFV